VIVFGVSYMAPAIVLSTFGVIATLAHGAAPTAYVFATLAMLLTALSYAKLARRYPASGSVYTYVQKVIGAKAGFLSGWTILLDYFFIPMVAWLITAKYIHVQFTFLPSWLWGILIIAFSTAVNIVGLSLADKVNKTLLCIVLVTLAVIVGVCIYYAAGTTNALAEALWPATTSIPHITAGAAVAAYSFLGFDAVSTLSEEVREPRRNVPRGIILIVLVGGVIFTIMSLVMQWAHPGTDFANEGTAGYEILTLISGPAFANVTNAILLVGALASCIAVQASGSRLLYVMGRDGVFHRKSFGYLHGRFKTPVFNLMLIAVIGLVGQTLTLGQATSLINFGAFLAFSIANVCVVILWYEHRADMRSWKSVPAFVVLPIVGVAVDLYLLIHLNDLALLIGCVWVAIGFLYLVYLTRWFRRPPPMLSLGRESG
jgi:amino acid transporter